MNELNSKQFTDEFKSKLSKGTANFNRLSKGSSGFFEYIIDEYIIPKVKGGFLSLPKVTVAYQRLAELPKVTEVTVAYQRSAEVTAVF